MSISLNEEDSILIIRRCISSVDGWKALAQSITSSNNPDAFDKCIKLFQKMAGDKEITIPATDASGNIEEIQVKYIDVLTSQLLKYINE